MTKLLNSTNNNLKQSLFLLLFYCIITSCQNQEKQTPAKAVKTNQITCTKKACQGTYKGKEFINGEDIAHQFSNQMSAKVGDQLKALYKSGDYSKVDFKNITMTTEGMGSGNVTYSLSIPFIAVKEQCEAYTAFDHVGGWNHTPALSQRKAQLKDVLMKDQQLHISDLKTTKEGLQEYWMQWKHKVVQAECE